MSLFLGTEKRKLIHFKTSAIHTILKTFGRNSFCRNTTIAYLQFWLLQKPLNILKWKKVIRTFEEDCNFADREVFFSFFKFMISYDE